MIVEVDDSLLENQTDLCVTDARWRLEIEQPWCSRVMAVDGEGNVICLVCDTFGASSDLAQTIIDQHNTALYSGGG